MALVSSTMWYKHLAPVLQIPLINADRMMLSILPDGRTLPQWAKTLRDTDLSWQRVAQQGVQAFVAQAMLNRVPFAMETVFSQWQERPSEPPASKIDLIRDMQTAGYFVLLLFVGLSTPELSIARVENSGSPLVDIRSPKRSSVPGFREHSTPLAKHFRLLMRPCWLTTAENSDTRLPCAEYSSARRRFTIGATTETDLRHQS